MKLDKRIEEAVPAGQQLQELGMRLRCLDEGSSDQVSSDESPHGSSHSIVDAFAG